jgi:hypothetical protein
VRREELFGFAEENGSSREKQCKPRKKMMII